MNTTSKIESTLSGKFSDIIDFLTAAGADDADQLARRAVGLIIATDAPQTGEESDTDPFVANMLACAALVLISENIKHYPFVSNSADFDQSAMFGINPGITADHILDSARSLIERAEAHLEVVLVIVVEASDAVDEAPANDAVDPGTGTPTNDAVDSGAGAALSAVAAG